jgi:hypothetical protein
VTRKKVKTSPLQREILWSLAENGERDLTAILNLLRHKFSHSRGALVKEVARSLGILERMGCLYLKYGSELPLELSVEWDEKNQGWIVKQLEPAIVDVVVHLTKGGCEVLDLIAQQSSEPTPVWMPK